MNATATHRVDLGLAAWLGLGFTEDLDQHLQEALGGVSVLGAVVRVELGHRERTRTFIVEQRAQYLAACTQRWGGSTIRVLGERRVEESTRSTSKWTAKPSQAPSGVTLRVCDGAAAVKLVGRQGRCG
jgi:hypothetical protein